MADRRIKTVCTICCIALRTRIIVFFRDNRTKTDAVQLVEAALVIRHFLEILAAFISCFGPAAVIRLEYQTDIDAKSISAR